ncbi:MAG: hypothetical protein Q9164_005853 [Protoblastenia rupestris]
MSNDEDDAHQPPNPPDLETLAVGRPSPNMVDASEEIRKLWTERVGDAWTLPPDHRILLGFQKHSLEKLSGYDLKIRLEGLQTFNDNLLGLQTPLDRRLPQRGNWFRHFTIHDTLPNSPSETQTYTIGRNESRSSPKSLPDAFPDTPKQVSSLFTPSGKRWTQLNAEMHAYVDAPWQRLM